MRRRADAGMTLIELLVAIGILGILATVGGNYFRWYLFYAGRAAMQVQMHQLAMAIRIQQDQGIAVPLGITDLTIPNNPACNTANQFGFTVDCSRSNYNFMFINGTTDADPNTFRVVAFLKPAVRDSLCGGATVPTDQWLFKSNAPICSVCRLEGCTPCLGDPACPSTEG